MEQAVKSPKRASHSRQTSHPNSETLSVTTTSPRTWDVESPLSGHNIKDALCDAEVESLLAHSEPKAVDIENVDLFTEHIPTGSWLVPTWVVTLDNKASGAIHILTCGYLDYLFILGAKLFGDRGMFLTILITVPIVGWQGMYFVAVCSIVTVVLVLAMKKFFRRARPALETLGNKRFGLRQALKSYSFPSGDSAQAGSFAMSMFLLTGEKTWGVVAIIIAVWGRIYFGCHYVSDCLCGTLLGLLVPRVLYEILSRPIFSISLVSS